MKQIFALVLSLALAGQIDAAPKEKESRKGAKVAAGASGMATHRGTTMRAQPQPTRSFSTGERARVNVATNRSGSVTQSSIAPTRSTSVYRQQTTSSQRVGTRDWDGDRDWDRDRDADRYRDSDW